MTKLTFKKKKIKKQSTDTQNKTHTKKPNNNKRKHFVSSLS